MSIPGLPSGNRARVYEVLINYLVTDPVLESVVKHWITAIPRIDGIKAPACASTETTIRLTPLLGPVQWYSPDAQLGNLQVKVEMLVVGTSSGSLDMLDVLNLWEAVENAFYPVGDQTKELAIQKALRDAGSHTGLITFSQPTSFAGADENTVQITPGLMQVDVIRAFNP